MNDNNIDVKTENRTPQELLTQNGANYVETGSTPRHVDTSTLDPKKKSPLGKIIFVIILLLFGVWAYMVYVDHELVTKGEEPKYCFWPQETKTYENGTIEECYGLLYKVIKYRKEGESLDELVPIWVETRSLDDISNK